MVKAILFDMNGVLVDDEALHERAFRQALADVGIEVNHSDYLESFAGRDDENGLRSFLRSQRPNLYAEADRIRQSKAAKYRELAVTGLRGFPGLERVILSLRDSGHVLGLVTSSTREEVQATLEALGLTDRFQVTVTAEDVMDGKPAPEPYLIAAARLQRAASDCVVVEDSPAGIQAAKAAGMYCVAVASTHPAEALKAADAIVGSLVGLLDESVGITSA